MHQVKQANKTAEWLEHTHKSKFTSTHGSESHQHLGAKVGENKVSGGVRGSIPRMEPEQPQKLKAVLVASNKSLLQRKGLLDLRPYKFIFVKVVASMRGSSADEVAERILSQPSLAGLQGPTISPVFRKIDGVVRADYYAIVICVPKKSLYKSVQQLRAGIEETEDFDEYEDYEDYVGA
ncbi:ATP phosphoribosyltransferase, catalytic domain-containing protein [Artemisia annua]|uniref:ATP phosphoribosyltransferase, catalytic domain-containing protein n=1 Tax=Artemisia annua TaxID=35608 RepID=A0A2U1LA92_ARTAN|nr:ATP phosphoribosyltransferase, catalytic domain-containing protein [Artemisia annua]